MPRKGLRKMTEAGGQEQGAIIDMFPSLSGPFMCADRCLSLVKMSLCADGA